MLANITMMGLALLEGIALILSPCIWPILPIILSGSLQGNKSRPLGIIFGFAISFVIVTLFSRALIAATQLNPETLRHTSLLLLFILGLVMLSNRLNEKFNLLTQRLTNVGSNLSINHSESGFFSGLLFGGLVGIIWTPCAGPILAAVIVQATLQTTTLHAFLITLFFAIGAGIPMLIIAFTGRALLKKLSFLRDKTPFIRKCLGIIIILSVIFLYYETQITLALTNTQNISEPTHALENGLERPYPAPEIIGIDAWINSPPLQLSQLKGKVILIDFWTYSCINCIRTLPYLKEWYAKYHDQGFEIIGIHSPEFIFEHSVTNVKNAVAQFQIKYPVALDNAYKTWNNYQNQYWPAHYLINKNGEVVYQHFGEGEYDTTENNIRYLLGMTQPIVTQQSMSQASYLQTPETYLGYERANHFASLETVQRNQIGSYTYPSELGLHDWALQGQWKIFNDKIVSAESGAAIKLHFYAKNVYAVIGSQMKDGVIQLHVNNYANKNRSFKIGQHQLYTLLDFPVNREATLELITNIPGIEIYTFTFGG